MRSWIENNFGILLVIGACIGLLTPSLGDVSNYLVIFLISGLVYFVCPKIRKEELLEADIFQIGLFTLLRFALLPIFLYFLANQFLPEYAIGILLLSLMPAAMAVASLSMISGAKPSLGIAVTVISSFLVPVFVPATFAFLGHNVDVNEFALFATLAFVVFGPFLIYYYGFGRIKAHSNWVDLNGKASSVIIMALVLLIVISSYKEELFSNPALFLESFVIMFALFAIFYAFGYVFAQFLPKEQTPTFVFSSGAMNNGLAIGLSFIYFSPQTTFFVVISEIVWCFYVALAQKYFSKRASG